MIPTLAAACGCSPHAIRRRPNRVLYSKIYATISKTNANNINQLNSKPFILTILDRVKEDYPNVKVRLIGIQSPSINGGIAANYGASGNYSDVFGEVATAYNYDSYLEKICEREEYKYYCKYIDMKAQFDVEYNMPCAMMKVNVRSEITELVGTNGVHPTMSGYLQIGDVFYRALVADMKNEK